MLETNAPAKINLYLHVTGRRTDGYHLLDSLVAFTNVGDSMVLEESKQFEFAMNGPMAATLNGQNPEGNLVVRAARALAQVTGKNLDVRLTLTKNLPVASGIGGGSTDAAAALRLLAAHWKIAPDAPVLHDIAKSLGQDIPCCIAARTCFFRGIGDVTDAGPSLPDVHLVLVNPNKALPTPAVFKARQGDFAPEVPLTQPVPDLAALVAELAKRTNSLTDAAISLCPDIQAVLDALGGQKGCLLPRMSGSGATCFGIFEDRNLARAAAATIYKAHPDWWVVPTFLPTKSGAMVQGG